jgi:competence protein ComEC
MNGRIGKAGIWWKWGRVQWVIAIGLLPLSLLFFQRVSIIAPIANSIVVPWVSFLVVPFVLLAVIFSGISESLGTIMLEITDWQLDRLWQFLEYLAYIPMAQWSYALPSLWVLAPVLIAVLLLLAPRGFPSRNLAGIYILPLFLVQSALPEREEVWLHLLDVGQGLATVVRTRNHVLVYDTGPKFSDTFNTGSAVVIPFLRQAGISKIDTLVVSHGDNDHIGGAADITAMMAVKNIFSGELEKIDWTTATSCIKGTSWQWDGVNFQFIHPPESKTFKRNDRSCVLRIQAPGGSVLLTGDIHRKSEKYLLKHHKSMLNADILVAPHHGSKTSSGWEFVSEVNPKIVLFPVGYRNRFGHPRQEVVGRYEKTGSKIYDSATHGAISIKISPNSGISMPKAYRIAEKRYWNRP